MMLLPVSWRRNGNTPTVLGRNYNGKGLSVFKTLNFVYLSVLLLENDTEPNLEKAAIIADIKNAIYVTL